MGHSDDDSDFAAYGTALEPIEEDDVARKRPITVAEQIAVDERGRRRFHGAFTGGFSAGYFNTVGSKEGWTPSTFKSSRGDRSNALKSQNVLDFMDDEDKGAFGIAPQVLRPTDDFSDKSESRGRKRPWSKQSSDGPIPGMPVLDQIIQPVKETVGIKILIKMGWRPGKGVGPKLQRKAKRARITEPEPEIEKPTIVEEEGSAQGPAKVYGCSIPPEFLKRGRSDDSEDSSDEDLNAEELLAPDDVSALLCSPKENSFGLGYKGLDRNTLTSADSHVDLFGTKLKFRVDNKKMSITGEAFGVGAFEENDDDIYSREDMSQYDFALETPEERRKRKTKEEEAKRKPKTKDNCIEGFRISTSTKFRRKAFPPPPLPPNFQPFHANKKSRFGDKDANSLTTPTSEEEATAKGLARHSLKISERQVLIEDDINKVVPIKRESETGETSVKSVEPEPTGSDRTVAIPKAQPDHDDIYKRIERLKKFTQVLQAYSSKKPEENVVGKAAFKPFMKNPDKQERYDKYLTLVQAGFEECLRDLQPPEMEEWEREREKMEFERASKLYKPMNSIMSTRFVSAKSHDISHLNPERESVQEKDPKDDPKVAAQMKLFGKLTHRVVDWHPDKLVCKRFNIPHPYPDSKFVGVKGDASLYARASKSAKDNDPSPETTVAIPSPAPKKSLFDNLDFSKPPPGLLPPGTNAEDFVKQMETSADDDQSRVGTRPALEFHKELSNKNDANANQNLEDGENIAPERPPMDLFKEIFADSSDSEEENEATSSKRDNQTNLNKEHTNTITLSETPQSTSENKKLLPSNKVNLNQPRGIFDRIDLDNLQPQVHRKSEDVEEDEEMKDSYGPLPPKGVSSSSTTSSKLLFQPSKAVPDSSTGPILFNKGSGYRQDEPKAYPNSDEVVWVEKNALKDRSSKSHDKSKKRSSKKSKKKNGKKDKRKSHKKEKKQKHKKKSRKHKNKGSDSSSSSDSEDDDSDASSDSSVTINSSLNIKALQQKLKQITKS